MNLTLQTPHRGRLAKNAFELSFICQNPPHRGLKSHTTPSLPTAQQALVQLPCGRANYYNVHDEPSDQAVY